VEKVLGGVNCDAVDPEDLNSLVDGRLADKVSVNDINVDNIAEKGSQEQESAKKLRRSRSANLKANRGLVAGRTGVGKGNGQATIGAGLDMNTQGAEGLENFGIGALAQAVGVGGGKGDFWKEAANGERKPKDSARIANIYDSGFPGGAGEDGLASKAVNPNAPANWTTKVIGVGFDGDGGAHAFQHANHGRRVVAGGHAVHDVLTLGKPGGEQMSCGVVL
jgi:hypothetical protein